MKKTLLWLGSLACVTLAGLYAYAWFNRDTLVDAFSRVEVGMTLEEAKAIMDRPHDMHERINPDGENTRCHLTAWAGQSCSFIVASEEGRVIETDIWYTEQTMLEKALNWIRDPSSLWAPSLKPVSTPDKFVEPPVEVCQ